MIDVQKYQQMGYSNQEIMEAMRELNQQQPQQSNTMISGFGNQDNLIKWQLELDSILERVEHILRGDKPTSVNGNLMFVPTNDEKDRIFNDYGVSEIMRILTMYLNRNTILSNYDEITINWKVLDFGNELKDLIYTKYNEMGLNTVEKRKRYPMIVKELVDTVHSSYLRALNGGERESLRTARSVQQQEPLGQNFGIGMPMKERSPVNPLRYVLGKYK